MNREREPVFQYDRMKKRRNVEGWNIICHKGEDLIGLTADEYTNLAFDFLMNEAEEEAKECLTRAIERGSAYALIMMGELLEEEKDYDEAYRMYLEAVLTNRMADALRHLGELYRKGRGVRKNDMRARELLRLSKSDTQTSETTSGGGLSEAKSPTSSGRAEEGC